MLWLSCLYKQRRQYRYQTPSLFLYHYYDFFLSRRHSHAPLFLSFETTTLCDRLAHQHKISSHIKTARLNRCVINLWGQFNPFQLSRKTTSSNWIIVQHKFILMIPHCRVYFFCNVFHTMDSNYSQFSANFFDTMKFTTILFILEMKGGRVCVPRNIR